MNRLIMWLLLAVVAASAAVLSFSALTGLALLCGFSPRLAWLLPLTVDAGAAAGCLVWLGAPEIVPVSERYRVGSDPLRKSFAKSARRFARALTLALLASSIAGNAITHYLAAYRLMTPWWLVVAVSAIAPAVLSAVVHLAVLCSQSHVAATESHAAGLEPAGRGDGPDVTDTLAGFDLDWPAETSPDSRTSPDPLTELIESGTSRRKLAAELGVSQYRAGQMLKAHQNGDGR